MDNWIRYTGTSKEIFYDLKLKNGRIILHCWPWKDNFNRVDGSGETYIEGDQVAFIRICDMQWDWTNPSPSPSSF